jgi:vitamin B12 transporter
MKKQTLLTFLTLPVLSLFAQETIPPLLVRDSPLSISQSGGLDTSLAAFLRYEPGVEIIPQGIAGGSSDISIRGSAFSGAGLSFGGVSLRNPQTEHFHTDFPFPVWWLAAPEVRTGTRQAARGEGHLAGTVALTPLPMRTRRIISGGVDSEGGFSFSGGLQYVQETLHGNAFGLGAFAGYMDAPNVDNLGNDVESARFGVQMQHLSPFGQTDVWAGFQEKTFGTRGYYGVNPDFASEETTKDSVLLAHFRTFDADAPLELSLMIREFQDDYRLWLPTGLFRNEHTTNTRAVEAGYRYPVNDLFGITGRASFDTEEIQSSNLGNYDRYRSTFTVLPDILALPNLRLFAGARAEIFEDFDNEFLPLARAELSLMENLLLYADYSESARRPSFTELNYESPASLGNAGLGVQTQRSAEIGAQWQVAPHTFTSIALFRNETRDTVDWIRTDAGAARWQAENIGTVTTLGAEFLLRQRVTDDLDVTGTLTLLDKDGDDEPFASRYALDYARQALGIQLDWQIQEGLRLEANQSFRNQADNNLRTRGGDTQFLTSLALHLNPEAVPGMQVSLSATNLLDDDFRNFAGQDTYAERRFAATVSYDW